MPTEIQAVLHYPRLRRFVGVAEETTAGLLATQMRDRPRVLAADPGNATAQRALFAARQERIGQPQQER